MTCNSKNIEQDLDLLYELINTLHYFVDDVQWLHSQRLLTSYSYPFQIGTVASCKPMSDHPPTFACVLNFPGSRQLMPYISMR